MLLAVPNVSEGRDTGVLDVIGAAFTAAGAHLLDRHADPDHNRAVFSLAAVPGRLAEAVAAGIREAIARLDISTHAGEHPRVGAVDVAPVVYPSPDLRGAAVAEALVLVDLLGTDLGLPVFLYGDLASGRTRAELRRGGPPELARRMERQELKPDAGPARLHPTAGAVLVAARPPLIAFNVELASPAALVDAQAIAGAIREGGTDGLPGVRAIGLQLQRQRFVQVSTNIEDPATTRPAHVLRAIQRHARIQAAELVGLTPRHAFDDFPPDVPLKGYDPRCSVIESVLAGT